MFGFGEHKEVYGGETHESKFSHELIAGAASFEAVSTTPLFHLYNQLLTPHPDEGL